MIRVRDKEIRFNEGDYGEIITFNLTDGNILPNDSITFIIEDIAEKNNIMEKQVTIKDTTTFELAFTQEESSQLKQGRYMWGLIWERDGELVDTLSIDNYLIIERGLYYED